MERERLIDHLLEHYVARDKFRIQAHDILQRRGLPTAVAHIDQRYGDDVGDFRVLGNTRKSLLRCKPATLDHLHDLLHQEPVLDESEHLHIDEDIFRFVIEEENDGVPAQAISVR